MNASGTALQGKHTVEANELYMAFELAEKNWKLSLGDGARSPSHYAVAAGDTAALLECIAKAKARCGLAPQAPTPMPCLAPEVRSGFERARGFGDVGCDGIHQGRGKTIVWLQTQLPQARAHGRHLIGAGARLDDRGDEGGELGSRPALLSPELGVNKIQTIEGVLGIFDAPVHMHATPRAGVPLDRRVGIHDLQFLGTLADVQLVAWHNGDLRERGASRLPALGASADVIVRRLGTDADLNGIARALAHQRPARKARCAGSHAIVDCRMNGNLRHRRSSLMSRRRVVAPWRLTTFLRPSHANEIEKATPRIHFGLDVMLSGATLDLYVRLGNLQSRKKPSTSPEPDLAIWAVELEWDRSLAFWISTKARQ